MSELLPIKDATEFSDLEALNEIYATAPVGLAVISTDGRFIRVNKRLADINGLPVEDHLNCTLEDVVPALAADSRAIINQILATGETVQGVKFSGETSAAPGTQRVWRESWSPIKHADGSITAINVVVEDITEQERGELALRESVDFTQRVLDSLFTFVGVIDRNGILQKTNQAPLTASGLAPADVIGKAFWNCHWWSHSAEAKARLREGFERAIAGNTIRYDEQVRGKGSSLIWIDFQLAPLRDRKGQITHVIASGTDISARREAERSLRLQYAEVNSLFKNAPLGLAFFDRSYRYLRINRELAQINGLPMEAHIGKKLSEIVPQASHITGLIDQVFETGGPIGNVEVDGETPRQPGIPRSWLTGFFPVELPDGELAAVGVWVVEITDRKRAEEKIQSLLSEINHRAKNILSIVQAIANQTLTEGPIEVAAKRFSERLQALASSHDLLVHNQWSGARLAELVTSQLSHVADLVGTRILIAGPDLLITPLAAQSIGMALHELTTNACKYGALSNAEGYVEIIWRITMEETPRFHISWREIGGPPVDSPSRKGFGSRLLTQLTGPGIGGEATISYPRGGVHWELSAPLVNLVSPDQDPA